MKKTLSLLLALVLSLSVCLSLTTVAFADPPDGYTSTAFDLPLKGKKYEGGAVNETVNFNVAATTGPNGEENPDTSLLPTVGSLDVANSTANGDGYYPVTLHIPSYTQPGTYRYTITEAGGSAQGVTYDTDPVVIAIEVYYDYNNECLATKPVVLKSTDDVKKDEFVNSYSSGSLEISKSVQGNLGDKSKEFDVTVTFTAEEGQTVLGDITYSGYSSGTISGPWTDPRTATIKVKNGDTGKVTFENIPTGVSYTVVEDAASASGYTVTYNGDSSENFTGTIGTAKDTCAIVNTQNMTDPPETGLFLDNLPYIVILAVVAAGAVVLFLRKRRVTD